MKKSFLFIIAAFAAISSAQTVTVGCKKFPESGVLGEIAKHVLERNSFSVNLKPDMGATAIVWNALRGGSIDVYPEYTGTVSQELLKKPGLSPDAMRAELATEGVGMSAELGFNNTYGLAMKNSVAQRLGIVTYSDLRRHPEVKCGITHELLGRKDGWVPLTQRYGLRLDDVKGIDHAIGYAALNSGQIDLTDCYTTDAEIQRYDLQVLQDDLSFFPKYRAVYLYRLSLPKTAIDALNTLGGTIDEKHMIAMNAEAAKSKDYAEAASLYFREHPDKPGTAPWSQALRPQSDGIATKIARLTARHLELVGVSLLLAMIVAVPLGIVAARPGLLSNLILGTAGVIQTVPSLALLALLVAIRPLGISFATAIIALFLYSLLPIVRNTATGIAGVSPALRESAAALGLEPFAQLRKVYLPLAMPTILAGIKTSAVINVGTATLAALIGEGGLGEPIVTGLSLNDSNMTLQGAVPAAVLAVLVQVAFDLLERAVVPRGLRIATH